MKKEKRVLFKVYGCVGGLILDQRMAPLLLRDILESTSGNPWVTVELESENVTSVLVIAPKQVWRDMRAMILRKTISALYAAVQLRKGDMNLNGQEKARTDAILRKRKSYPQKRIGLKSKT